MKWFEVIAGSDGYYTPRRFRTIEEAEQYVSHIEEEDGDVHVSEGPYEIDTESSHFYHETEE